MNTTITDLYIEHKNHLLRICFRSDDKLAYRKCKYGCGLVIGIKKHEEYVIENSRTTLPYFRRNHVIKSWYTAWEVDQLGQPLWKHECPSLRRVSK